MFMKKQLVLLILFIAGLSIGYFAGHSLNKKSINIASFNEGWGAARQRLIETGMIQPGDGDIVKTLMGVVEKKTDNRVEIKINAIDPLSFPSLDKRVVIIDDNTKIYKIVKKSKDEILLENDVYKSKVSDNNGGQEMPPLEYKTIEISRDDISVNQVLVVSSNNNIKELESFSAIKIVVQYNQ